MEKAIRIAAIGLGNRTCKYLQYVSAHPEKVVLAAVVEPSQARVGLIRSRFKLSPDVCFSTPEDFFAEKRDIDACIIGTPDNSHFKIAMRAIGYGYHLLIEKPVAQTLEECETLVRLSRERGVTVFACYVLRYHPYFVKIKELLARPCMGRPLSLTHVENVGLDRLAHTFVRGPWNLAEMNTPMFLAKCSHDVDFVLWLLGNEVEAVEFESGSRMFTEKDRPADSAERCVDCVHEKECRYSATDLYRRRRDWIGGFVPLEGESVSEAIERELESGRYGRCVYRCVENDVVEWQKLTLEMSSGNRAVVMMNCNTEKDNRETEIVCESACLWGDGQMITVAHKDGSPQEVYDFSWCRDAELHAGADLAIVEDFIDAVASGRRDGRVLIDEAIVSHLICLQQLSPTK